jgi:hypothetical protein
MMLKIKSRDTVDFLCTFQLILCLFCFITDMFCFCCVGFPFCMIYSHVENYMVWFCDLSHGCGMRAFRKAKREALPGRSGQEVVCDHSI